jgi:uncharacterized membrane protein
VFYFSNVPLAKPSDSLSVRQLGILIHAMSRFTPSVVAIGLVVVVVTTIALLCRIWAALSMRADPAPTSVSGNCAMPPDGFPRAVRYGLGVAFAAAASLLAAYAFGGLPWPW